MAQRGRCPAPFYPAPEAGLAGSIVARMRLAHHPRPTIHTPQILHLGSPASHQALPRAHRASLLPTRLSGLRSAPLRTSQIDTSVLHRSPAPRSASRAGAAAVVPPRRPPTAVQEHGTALIRVYAVAERVRYGACSEQKPTAPTQTRGAGAFTALCASWYISFQRNIMERAQEPAGRANRAPGAGRQPDAGATAGGGQEGRGGALGVINTVTVRRERGVAAGAEE